MLNDYETCTYNTHYIHSNPHLNLITGIFGEKPRSNAKKLQLSICENLKSYRNASAEGFEVFECFVLPNRFFHKLNKRSTGLINIPITD